MLLETNQTVGYMGAGVSIVDFNDDEFDELSFGHHSGELQIILRKR